MNVNKPIFKIILVVCIVCCALFSRRVLFEKGIIEESISIVSYRNDYMGFEMNILDDMEVDTSLEGLLVKLENKDTTINVFYDDFSKDIASYNEYIEYSDNFLKDNSNIIIENNITRVNDKRAHILSWTRRKLSRIENDKNYYYSAEIKLDNNRVYTILGKTNKPNLDEIQGLVKSFRVVGECKPLNIPDNYFKKEKLNVDENTRNVYNQFFSDESHLTWGIFDQFDVLDEVEEKIDYKFKFILKYQTFGTPIPATDIKENYENGRLIELSPQNTSTDEIYDVLDGVYDEYLIRYAKDIKALDIPILFRPNNEMNGDWCCYCDYHYSKDAELYVKYWQYIYNVFKERGVDNLLWVWNPNSKSFPNFSWNKDLVYYPGDEYVDIIGLTAYNTGNYYKGEYWTSFSDLYDDLYNEYSRIFEKPFMITEFACSTYGGDKVKWVSDMFDNLKNYPKIKVAIWWSYIDYDINGNEARVYCINRPKQVLDVFKKKIKENVR